MYFDASTSDWRKRSAKTADRSVLRLGLMILPLEMFNQTCSLKVTSTTKG